MALLGGDASQWQLGINWNIFASKLDFAFIKASQRFGADPYWAANWANSKGKLPRGAYHYFHQEDDGVAQAKFFIAQLGADWGELPPVVDVERVLRRNPDTTPAAWTNAEEANLIAYVSAILGVMGKRPIIYTGNWYWPTSLGTQNFGCPSLWCANYTASPLVPAAWATWLFWQYTNLGAGPNYGCEAPAIDLDQFNGDQATLNALINHPNDLTQVYIMVGNHSLRCDLLTDGPIVITSPVSEVQVSLDAEDDTSSQVFVTPLILRRHIPPPPHPIPTFTASANSIIAGQEVTLSWTNTDTASGIYLNGKDETGPSGSRSFTPQVTTEYVLRVTYPNEADAVLSQTVTVTQPKPVQHPVVIGVHVLANTRSAQNAIAQGAEIVTVMDDEIGAAMLATGDPQKWFPGCGYPLVLFRKWHQQGTLPWGHDIVGLLGGLLQQPNAKNVIITLWNEWDGGIGGADNSASGMTTFCDATIEAVNLLNARGFYNIAWLTSSMGTPDFTNAALCDVIAQKIAPLWNDGRIRYTDMHLYSPNRNHIFSPTMALVPSHPTPRQVIREKAGRSEYLATREVGGNPAMMAEGAFPPATIVETDWYETRWRFLYYRCGFNPAAIGRIVSSECGLDEGGIGGFAAHDMGRDEVNAYIRALLQLQAQPITINGVQYPSPFLGGTIFQADPNSAQWKGYDVSGMYPLLWKL